MGRHHLTGLALGLLFLATAVRAQHLPGGGQVQAVTQNGVAVCGGEANLELLPADFACVCTNLGVQCGTTKLFGSCIGEPGDWCGTVDLSATSLTLPALASLTLNPTAPASGLTINPQGTVTATDYMVDLAPSGVTVGGSGAFGAMRMNGTITLSGTPNAFGWFYFLQQNGTIQNSSGTAITVSGQNPYMYNMVYNANNANLTLNNSASLNYLPALGLIVFSPTFTITGSGVLAAADIYTNIWRPTVNTGATITTAGFAHIFDIQGTATAPITNLALFDVEDITNSKITNGPIIYRQKGLDDQNRFAGMTMIGADAAAVAHLQIREATINNEVVRWESGNTGTPIPSQRVYFARATAAASATTNIDFNLTTNRPTEPACPSGTVCVVDSLVTCHCTSGSACTADGGAVLESKWLFKNNAGTVAQIGTTASGFFFGQAVSGGTGSPTLTSTYVSSGTGFITSITQSLTSNAIREAVVLPVNSNMTCHVQHTVNPVGT